jgi:hypothetical protein
MRTTVTLDPETEALLREAMASRGVSFKRALNEAIQRGLRPATGPAPKPYRLKTFRSAYRSGVDRLRLNQLSDALETEAFAQRQGKRK